MSSSSPGAPQTGQWPPRRPSKRSKLRNGTVIIPATGERTRRQFTLRRPLHSSLDGNDDGNDDDGFGGTHGSSRSSSARVAGTAPFFSREGMSDRVQTMRDRIDATALRFWDWLRSPNGKGVLKCTLAYTLASLATFWAPLSDWLGKPDGKHLVATITVYFHPARTAGSMIEAILISLVAVAYAVVVSVLSMATSVFVGSTLGLVRLAHALVLIVFIGGAFGVIGWVKQRMSTDLVNVGSTLAALAIISVVTKETAVLTSVFSNQKIVQVLKMLVMAIVTTTAVNLLVWRVSARDLLRESTSEASMCLGDVLSFISRAFLSGSEDELLSADFTAASAAYAAVYPRMLTNLREAKFEYYFLGREKMYRLDRAVVKSLETLAQSIGGLRSAANTQFALLKEPLADPLSSEPLSPAALAQSPAVLRASPTLLRSGQDRLSVLSAIDESPDEGEEAAVEEGSHSSHPSSNGVPTPSIPPIPSSFRTPSDIFELFIALLGPSMKSLAYTLSEILREPPFGVAPDYKIAVNDRFRRSLADALSLFDSARADALQELYRQTELGRNRPEQVQADFEEVAAACGHFSFSLHTFGEEMLTYLDVLDDLRHASEVGSPRRSWGWMMFWKNSPSWSPSSRGGRPLSPRLSYEDDSERDALVDLPPAEMPQEPPIRRIKKTAMPRGIPDAMLQRRDTYNWEAAAQQTSLVARLSQWLLKSARKIARDDFRFGIKVGVGATLWAMFAFIPETRETYEHWRGEWGLLSFMIVCSMTVGASNTTGVARFMGTLIGVAACYANWTVSRGNALALIVLGWFVAFWAFWMIVHVGRAPLGRITLLAYNVSTLYAYSLSQKVDDNNGDEDEGGTHPFIGEIVRHRAVAVTAGILWGLVVCRVIWPISARRKFKEGLAVLYLQMGLIWRRGPLAILLRANNSSGSGSSPSYLRSGEQAALQRYASRLESLRQSASSEFELRGPFPAAASAHILRATDRVLDAFHAMALLVSQRQRGGVGGAVGLSDGEKALLLFTARERAYLCHRICHVFQVLASSLMLEYSLTDAIPSVAGARDRLLSRIFLFRKEHDGAADAPASGSGGDDAAGVASASTGMSAARSGGGAGGVGKAAVQAVVEEKDYALLYAYALVTGQVLVELKAVEREIEALFGVFDEDAMLLQ